MSMKRILGLLFVVGLAAALSMSVLSYRKAFTPAVFVTLHTDHTGLQLNSGADVKLHGVIVGQVRAISANGRDATLRLALDPGDAAQIPDNVTAQMLPETLFGERYVALQTPAQASAAPLRNGSVIDQDHSSSAVELQRVIDEALPLLRAIAPDKLAATLGALATALDGRGERLGQDLVTFDGYLTALNAQLPAIRADISKLAQVLATYDGALPDLMAVLRNVTITATTVSDQRDQLAAFLDDTADLGNAAGSFLDRYGDRIIQVGSVTAPVLNLLAAYSPEYPCLLEGVVALQPRVEQVFAGGQMHITIEVTRDNGGYVAGRDDPVYGARTGPNCRGLPHPAVPAPAVAINDGYDHSGNRAPAPLPVGLAPVAMGYAGTAEEQNLLDPIVAGATGTPVAQVPDVADLLWGPLLRGTVVNMS
jgi:phospholipid/cholesterol/gamma-HCH transport system substrate-binding protein